MPISTKEVKDVNQLIISIEERFDFSVHQKFRESYIQVDTPNMGFVLDLALTTYMDSSALGMILLLKDHAESLSGSVVIKNPSETVNKILEIAQFHRLLTIEK
jgi:anti-anti-sigma factor